MEALRRVGAAEVALTAMILGVGVAGGLPSTYTSWVPAEPAHAVVFAVLAATSYVWARRRLSDATAWCALFALSLGLVVGALDELRQLLVTGRNGDTRDLLVDCIGTMTGLACAVPAYRFYLSRKSRETPTSSAI